MDARLIFSFTCKTIKKRKVGILRQLLIIFSLLILVSCGDKGNDFF